MSDLIHCDDGCDLSPEEVLARLQIGLKSDEELHPDFPDEGRELGPPPILFTHDPSYGAKILTSEEVREVTPTDRGLLLLALPSKGEGISDEKEAVELPSNRTD